MARILLIDDDDGVRKTVRMILDRHGHTVIEARDGAEGLELVPRANADLLITDLVMPGKGGLAVLAELREKYPALKAIAMSGGWWQSAVDPLHLAEALGAAKVLAKPFSLHALMAAVDELLAPDAAEARDLAR